MATDELLYEKGAGLIAVALLALMLIASEIGFRLGLRARAREGGGAYSSVAVSAMLGLLGLLLAFTYSMAEARYDGRRLLEVRESNAIGTSYLRARLLKPPRRAKVEAALRSYVDARLEFYTTLDADAALEKRTDAIQESFWRETAAEGLERPDPVMALALRGLNEVIDARASQSVEYRSHVPETILLCIFAISILSLLGVGYENGLAARRHVPFGNALAAVLALAVFLVMDLDRPRRGLIRVPPRSLLELKTNLAASPTGAP